MTLTADDITSAFEQFYFKRPKNFCHSLKPRPNDRNNFSAPYHNRVVKRAQHVTPSNVGRYCAECCDRLAGAYVFDRFDILSTG